MMRFERRRKLLAISSPRSATAGITCPPDQVDIAGDLGTCHPDKGTSRRIPRIRSPACHLQILSIAGKPRPTSGATTPLAPRLRHVQVIDQRGERGVGQETQYQRSDRVANHGSLWELYPSAPAADAAAPGLIHLQPLCWPGASGALSRKLLALFHVLHLSCAPPTGADTLLFATALPASLLNLACFKGAQESARRCRIKETSEHG